MLLSQPSNPRGKLHPCSLSIWHTRHLKKKWISFNSYAHTQVQWVSRTSHASCFDSSATATTASGYCPRTREDNHEAWNQSGHSHGMPRTYKLYMWKHMKKTRPTTCYCRECSVLKQLLSLRRFTQVCNIATAPFFSFSKNVTNTGELQQSATPGTSCYLNPDVPETDQITHL